jgi:DNA-binding response OmpR family regulator
MQRTLSMLLQRPGEIIMSEELQKKLWPADTFVDFDKGLNSAVTRLRARGTSPKLQRTRHAHKRLMRLCFL